MSACGLFHQKILAAMSCIHGYFAESYGFQEVSGFPTITSASWHTLTCWVLLSKSSIQNMGFSSLLLTHVRCLLFSENANMSDICGPVLGILHPSSLCLALWFEVPTILGCHLAKPKRTRSISMALPALRFRNRYCNRACVRL